MSKEKADEVDALADQIENVTADILMARVPVLASKLREYARDLRTRDAGVTPELTFGAFRAANVTRCVKWHPAGIESWSPSDWMTAVTGELGELASLLKMRNRERDRLPGNKFSPTQKQIADELADVLTYLDLLAAVLGVNLGEAAVAKFNEVSERVGFPDRIELAVLPLPDAALERVRALGKEWAKSSDKTWRIAARELGRTIKGDDQ